MSTKANIVIEQNSDFSVPITLTNDDSGEPLVITGFTANASLRKYYTASNVVLFDTNLVDGCLTISMNAANTANIAAGRYVYDVLLHNTPANVTSRLVEGIVTVLPGVTANV